MTKKRLFITLLIAIYSTLLGSEVTKYIRYVYQGQESYGIMYESWTGIFSLRRLLAEKLCNYPKSNFWHPETNKSHRSWSKLSQPYW